MTVPEFTTIRYDATDRLGRITLARPEKRNAVKLEMFTELGDAAELAAWEWPGRRPPPEMRLWIAGDAVLGGVFLVAATAIATTKFVDGRRERPLPSLLRISPSNAWPAVV